MLLLYFDHKNAAFERDFFQNMFFFLENFTNSKLWYAQLC